MTQDQAFNVLTTGVNVFLTGEPGSGKTHTVNRYVRWLREHRIEPAITASTGIAATHIGGATIHSWSGIGIKRTLTSHDLGVIAGKSRVVERVSKASVLIIDEVSMLGTETLTMIDLVCRKIRGNHSPFGGMQLVLVGDFFQLPPIVSREARDDGQRSLLSANSASAQFAFSSPAWKALQPVVCYLSEQHRQEDAEFLGFLSALREGRVDAKHRALLQTRGTRVARDGATQLFSHNIDVDRINEGELSRLPGAATVFTMNTSGLSELVEPMKRGCLSPENLTLKIGAKVMFTKNDPLYRFVNGTLGTITGFSSTNGYPTVRLLSGRTVVAEPTEWSLEEGGDVLARLIQVPLRLAWAITVHKSQGMSLDAAHMDLSQVFEYGQGYVALSRVRTLAGLTIAGINERALEVHPEIQLQDIVFREASRQAEKRIVERSSEEILELQHDFIERSGGAAKAGSVVRKEKAKRSTFDATRELVAKKLTPDEMVAERGLSFNTILGHLEKLIALHLLDPAVDLAYLRPDEGRFEKIRTAFKKVKARTDALRLTPTRELLDETFSFEELRIARLFLGDLQ